MDVIIPQDKQGVDDKLFYNLSDFTYEQMLKELQNTKNFKDQLLILERFIFYDNLEYGRDMDSWKDRSKRKLVIIKSIRNFIDKINKIIYNDQNKNIHTVTRL